MKKLLTAILSAAVLLSVYSCGKGQSEDGTKMPHEGENEVTLTEEDYKKFGKSTYYSNLTLDDVKELSKIGENLSWDDFASFGYIETGSGLYIRVYETDEDYKLMIGGAGPQSLPMYIYLDCLKAPYERIDIRYDDVQSFLDRTEKIKEDTQRFTAVVVQNGEVTVPSGKSEDGMTVDNGKLVLSVMDAGNTEFKLDDLYCIIKSELTGDIPTPRLLKGDIVRVELDGESEVIPFGKVPYKIEKAVSIQRCRENGEVIKPLEGLAESYTIYEAEKDGCVVFKDFDVICGKEYFDSFLANVKYKSCANVRLAFYYAESGNLFINDLYFNGTDFTIREMESGTEVLQTYTYLRPFITDDNGTSAILRYTLTNDPDVTYDRLFEGALSSRYGDYIPFRDVYMQAGFVRNGEFYDNSMIAFDNPKPESIITP